MKARDIVRFGSAFLVVLTVAMAGHAYAQDDPKETPAAVDGDSQSGQSPQTIGRYTPYIWTSNASLGQTSHVVVAGNLNYSFSEHFTFGGGIRRPARRPIDGRQLPVLAVGGRTPDRG